MSFSKARIQRFNELGSEAPPPGAYDPKFDNKVKGLAIEKTERFHDTKSVSSGGAECMSVSSKGAGSTSGQSGNTRKFKTPPVPRKRVIVKPASMSCPRAKSKPLIASKDSKSQYDLQNELADLRVECSNKDRTILEQEKHIEEMKGEISAITKRLNELSAKFSADEEQHKKDIESMATLQQEVWESQKEKHNAELDFLRSQLEDLTNFKKEEILELDRRDHELEEEILTLRRKETELNQRIATLESNLSNAQGAEELAMNLKKAEEKLNELSTEMLEIIESKDRDLENLMEARTEAETELYVLQQELTQSQARFIEAQRHLEDLSERLRSLSTSVNNQIISEIVVFLQRTLKNPLNPEEDFSIFLVGNQELGETVEKIREVFKVLMNQKLEDFKSKFETLEKENQAGKLMRQELETKSKESRETIDFLNEELRDVQKLYQDVSLGLQKAKAKLETTEERLAQAEEAHKAELGSLSKLHEEEQSKLKNLMEETRLEYLQQLENMSAARNQELEEVKEATEKMIEEEKKRIKEHADKLVENAEAVTRETLAACRAESEERVKRVIAETDAKVNSIGREVKKAAEEEVRLANERFSTSSKRFEAEKSSLEEKLTEKDSEISQLRTALDELKSTAETQESFSQSLQAELDRAEAELAEKKEELRNLKDHIRSEAAEMVARRRRFEVVMSENQASVCALTNRIAESDAEVKRLQRELETSESSLREHRDLLSSVQSNSKVLQEQVHAITDQLKEKESLIDQLKENCKTEIESFKSALESKIENVMEVTAIRVSKLQEDCLNKSKLNAELKQLLDEMASKWNEVQSTLLNLEEQSDEQLIEISTLQTINAKLELDLKNQTTLVCESKARENEIEEAKAQINDLRIKVETLETKNLCMKEEMVQSEEQRQNWKTVQHSLMEDLERERAGREKTEREMKVLSESFERFRGEYEELTEKYTEVLGHHNHNQRIKHISKLKDKILTQQKDNLRLKKELESKTNLLEQLTKNSERAKLEEKRKVGKGKENISSSYGKATPLEKVRTNSVSLSKSASTTPTASPNKTLTPLRNRNE